MSRDGSSSNNNVCVCVCGDADSIGYVMYVFDINMKYMDYERRWCSVPSLYVSNFPK